MRARALAVGLAVVAYVVLSHWLMTRAPASGWNAVVVVGPLLVAAAAQAWKRRQHAVAALAGLGIAALVLQAWRGGGWSPNAIYVAQHVVIHLLLAGTFAATLRPGREPLITRLARSVHDCLTPAMVAYCRKATLAWAIYFLAMAAVSLALCAWAPFDVWAAFANLATPLALLLMFGGEYVLRYRLHPEFERVTFGSAMSAYAAHRSAVPAPRHD